MAARPLKAVRPLFALTRRTKAAFAAWLKQNDPGRRAHYLALARDRAFDNLTAAYCLFFAMGAQNVLADPADPAKIKAARPPADGSLFRVLREAVAFAAEIKAQSSDDYSRVSGQCAQKAASMGRELAADLCGRFGKGQDEHAAVAACFESLLAFGFADLYAYRIEVAGADAEFARYGALAELIIRESELLEGAYAPFRAVNAPVLNVLFWAVLTLRKRLV